MKLSKSWILLAGAACLLGNPALMAQEDAPTGVATIEQHKTAAWNNVYDIASDYLPAHAVSELQMVAYHLAAEQLCDGVHTDAEKVGGALLGLRPDNWDELSESKQKVWNDALKVSFGMVIGVMIAEHADSTTPFCEEVSALMANPEVDWDLFADDGDEEVADDDN